MYINFEKDILQKLALISFAQAVLVLMGDSRKVVRFHPTEMIIPTFRQRLMDGVLELDDGILMNIEFQTGNIGEKFLLRCAQYAINLRVISGKFVETNILSTGIREKSKLYALISKFFHFKPKTFFYSEFNGLEKLINIKNKIEHKEKLTLLEQYELVFIPLMGNVDKVKAAFEVFNIVNTPNLFSEDELENIKRCQYVVAHIVANGNNDLFNEFWEVIKVDNSMLEKHDEMLAEKVAKRVTAKVTSEVTEKVTAKVTTEVSHDIARNFKDVLADEVIAERTGLPIEVVRSL